MDGFILKYCNLKCSRAVPELNNLVANLETALKDLNIRDALQQKFASVQIHHLPKIGISGCPNGCSQPQIKDIGIMGYLTPQITLDQCSMCHTCTIVCVEQALYFSETIHINNDQCLACGDCTKVCPTGSLELKETGWNLLLGGKLGRHPRLGHLVGQTQDNNEVIHRTIELLKDYIENAPANVRFSSFLESRI